MARFELDVDDERTPILVKRGGAHIPLLRQRIRITAELTTLYKAPPPAPFLFPCIVDTGAYYTLIPDHWSSQFDLDKCPELPLVGTADGKGKSDVMGIKDCKFTVREVRIPFIDRHGSRLIIPLICKFTEDRGGLRDTILIGLRGGFFENWSLRADWRHVPKIQNDERAEWEIVHDGPTDLVYTQVWILFDP